MRLGDLPEFITDSLTIRQRIMVNIAKLLDIGDEAAALSAHRAMRRAHNSTQLSRLESELDAETEHL